MPVVQSGQQFVSHMSVSQEVQPHKPTLLKEIERSVRKEAPHGNGGGLSFIDFLFVYRFL